MWAQVDGGSDALVDFSTLMKYCTNMETRYH